MSHHTGWGQPASTTTATKTLADFVKESAWHSSVPSNNTTSMPWAAAVKSPPEHNAASMAAATVATGFDYNNTIGSWSTPETSSSNRSGWNADGSSKNGGALDDGTAIWGNPTTKKTGIDWTEKESSMNPPQTQTNNNFEKRIQKAEPTISSINGTEAWGAPLRSSLNSQQKQSKNDISGNTFDTTKNVSNHESSTLSWGESSSLQSVPAPSTNENSSPPKNSVWNNLGISNNKQKSSEWLSSTSGIGSGSNSSAASSRLEELNKQLESVSLFDPVSVLGKNASPLNINNSNLEHNHSIAVGSGLGGSGGSSGGNGINDLKQMSANYSNDLLGSPNRQPGCGSLASNNSQQSQQLESNAYSSAVAEAAAAPSRDLLKQMVHQIQLAVQAGHLNAHILNQPMSAPTLHLVYQLLQQIKTLHQLQEIQQRAGIKSDMSPPSNMDLQINRIRQHISLLQKAITQQQAALIKSDSSGDSNISKQQLAANNYSYATISKLSTNMKVPSNNMSNIITNSNIDSFRRSSLIDTLSNSSSDSLRSAQAPFDANATLDKTLSSLLMASSSSSANNILCNKTVTNPGDFSKTQQGFTNSGNQQHPNKGLLPAQSSSPAWSAFSSNDFVNQQSGWPTQLRISSNVSQDQQHQFSAFQMMPDPGAGKVWRGSSNLQDGIKASSNSMAPGSANTNIIRPNSASNNLKQVNENDILSRDQSLFCDWTNNSESGKRNFDPISSAASSFSSSAIGGLSLQSNPWMFAPNSTSLNIAGNMDNTNKTNSSGGNLSINKMDNGNIEKMAGDSLFLKSSNIQRSPAALYDWSDLSTTNLQFNPEGHHLAKRVSSGSSSDGGGGRPAPPPGLMNNFRPLIENSPSANGVSLLDSKLGVSSDESSQLQSRDSSSSLWSGTWFD